MINMAARKGVLFDEIRKNLGTDHDLPLSSDGRDAAVATLRCMHEVATILPPRRLMMFTRRASWRAPAHDGALE
jgi:hypothetical protein